jgi:acetyl-CoA carboxylase carboxyltransferase component
MKKQDSPGTRQVQSAQSENGPAAESIRPELAELQTRKWKTSDEARPEAVARRRKTHQRTARENVADLCDADSFIEYGGLAVAAQRMRHDEEELVKRSPADGLISGIGTVNAAAFGAEKARCMVLAYDYTVFAGTQGATNHKKMDRMLELAEQWKLPIVLFAEGGGGRPNDTDWHIVAGLDLPTFGRFARLSGVAPRVGIASGRCFAGNASLLGCCDVIIATENANIGMGGPPMVEGGGLGTFAAEEIGPIEVQCANGVVDVRVADEAEAVRVAKQYLSYFQGPLAEWRCGDEMKLRDLIPENRRRAYVINKVIEAVADTGSVLELRKAFGKGITTALVRIEGRPMGLVANNPRHLGGAIDADASDKMARFLQLCDAFGLPILSLCDTPGFMVGPATEKTAQVRHTSRIFVTAASVTVPWFTIVLRKAYGLGAMAMAGGGTHSPFFTVAWTTGEFGAMGLEGAVNIAFKNQLAEVEDPAEREAMFQQLVGLAYQRGKAINTASYLEIDDVIDPADTRRWLVRGLQSAPVTRRFRRMIDTW